MNLQPVDTDIIWWLKLSVKGIYIYILLEIVVSRD